MKKIELGRTSKPYSVRKYFKGGLNINQDLLKKDNETDFQHHKRIVMGKLVTKTFSDEDYTDLSELAYGQRYSSDVARRMFYGSRDTIQLMENCQIEGMSDKSILSQAKELVGEQFLLKKQLQSEKIQINKFKNDFIRSIAVADEIKEYLSKTDFNIEIPSYCHIPLAYNKKSHSMIVCISDWHIGCTIINCKGNTYNWEVANDRVNILIETCLDYIDRYDISQVYVYNLGDTIESTYMRKNQSQYCEFFQGEQIAKATELIYRLLVALCEKCYVQYDGVAGNHDRFVCDKSENLDGDNANSVITPMLSKFTEISGNKRLCVVNRNYSDKEIVANINGVLCKFVHGDKSVKKDNLKLKSEISMDNQFYDLYFEGHWHNYKSVSENRGRYQITTGCLSGFNDYSSVFGCSTVASQTIVILGQDEVELIKDVQLQK